VLPLYEPEEEPQAAEEIIEPIEPEQEELPIAEKENKEI